MVVGTKNHQAKASELCPEDAGASGVSHRGLLMTLWRAQVGRQCHLSELQTPTQQVWGNVCISHGCPQVQSLLGPRPHQEQPGIGAALKSRMEGRGTTWAAGKLEWNPALNSSPRPDLSAAATAPLHTTSLFQNLPQHLGEGPLLQSLRPLQCRGNSAQTREPGLSAINNSDRFNKYKCTTAICGDFMRN